MQAVILAAGTGSRLGADTPKCLQPVGGRTLIGHQIDGLARAGVTDVLVVVGYEHEQIRRQMNGSVTYTLNERYEQTNSLYSFLRAGPWIRDDVLVLNGDLLVHPEVIDHLASTPEDAIAIDSSSGDDPEQMKVEVRAGGVVGMSKDLPSPRVAGENLGLLRFSARTARRVLEASARIVDGGRENDWLASAVTEVAVETPLGAVDVAGSPWVEVDFPDDLVHARTTVWPAIHEDLQRWGPHPLPRASRFASPAPVLTSEVVATEAS